MLYSSPAITAYVFFVVTLVGLCMGSFLNCLAWRSAHGESVLKGRSHCDSCGHELGFRDLIPVVSWLSTRGRCRYCGERVSVRNPVTELVCAAAFVSILLVWNISYEATELMAFACVLLVLSLTDIDSYVIPNGCIVAAVAVRLLYLAWVHFFVGFDVSGLLVQCLISAAGVGGAILLVVLLMDKALGRESMGFGDVKLLAVAAFYFGWRECLLLIIVACLIGLVVAAVGQRHGEPAGSVADAGARVIPWGPSIAAACWFVMLFGTPIMLWYIGIF